MDIQNIETPKPVEIQPMEPKPVETPTSVISGENATPTPNVPPVSSDEPKQDVSTPVETAKVEIALEPPYTYINCPKCNEEIKEEYFYASKKVKNGGKGSELGYTARAEETGDRVFLVHDKKRYWVKNPETLSKLGFNLGQEKSIPFAELLQFPEYEPIDLTVPGSEFPRKDEVSPEEKKKAESGKPYRIWS